MKDKKRLKKINKKLNNLGWTLKVVPHDIFGPYQIFDYSQYLVGKFTNLNDMLLFLKFANKEKGK